MPLDVLGRTRVTMARTASVRLGIFPGLTAWVIPNAILLVWDCPLQLLVMNEEFLVVASH